MKTFNLRRDALGICAAVALLSGCGGSQSDPAFSPGTVLARSTDGAPLPAATPLERRDFMLSGEVLTARGSDVHVQPRCPAGAGFRVRGNATGPYPGTFSASGF
jgi:hypothetical protein